MAAVVATASAQGGLRYDGTPIGDNVVVSPGQQQQQNQQVFVAEPPQVFVQPQQINVPATRPPPRQVFVSVPQPQPQPQPMVVQAPRPQQFFMPAPQPQPIVVQAPQPQPQPDVFEIPEDVFLPEPLFKPESLNFFLPPPLTQPIVAAAATLPVQPPVVQVLPTQQFVPPVMQQQSVSFTSVPQVSSTCPSTSSQVSLLTSHVCCALTNTAGLYYVASSPAGARHLPASPLPLLLVQPAWPGVLSVRRQGFLPRPWTSCSGKRGV